MVERLRSHREFSAVLRCRRKVSDSDIVVHVLVHDDVSNIAMPSDSDAHASISSQESQPRRRIGFAVSKHVGNAVVRNHVKRRFRALSAQYETLLPAQCDIVIRAKPSAAHTSYTSLESQIAHCFSRIGRKYSEQQ